MVIKLDKPRNTTQYLLTANSFRLKSRKILSSKKETPYNNFGSNLQNIEPKIRVLYEADNEYKLVSLDQEGAEAKIVAYLCKKGNYRKLFENNIKPHSFTALHIFTEQLKAKYHTPSNIDIAINTEIDKLQSLPFCKELFKLIKDSDNWPGKERYYFIGKKVRHASAYGMRENKYRMSLLEESEGSIAISKKEAEFHLSTDRKLFPEISQWQLETEKTIRSKKELRNLFGFPFKFTSFLDDAAIRNGLSFVPQSTVATLTNIAFSEMQEYIEDNDRNWHLLNNDHDSILGETPEEEAGDYIKVMKKLIEEKEFTSPVDGVKFHMTAEVKVGYNWASMSVDNPLGLKEINE